MENSNITGPYIHISLPALKEAGLLVVNCACQAHGAVLQQKYKDSQGCASISNLFGRSLEQKLIHTSRVSLAEVEMVNLIAMHNLSFQAADHLSDLFPSMFPDSAMAADFACCNF